MKNKNENDFDKRTVQAGKEMQKFLIGVVLLILIILFVIMFIRSM